MEIQVSIISETPNSTLSKMEISGEFSCFVIEDGSREKKIAGETRIPAGQYSLAKRTYGRFYDQYRGLHGHKFALEIQGVPGFSDVLIHTGNTVLDTRGCLLVCDQVGKGRDGNFFGLPRTSTPAYTRLYSIIERAFSDGETVSLVVSR